MRSYDPTERVDVCIVGAGLGGIMARILAEAGLSVVVLDAGPHWNPPQDFVNDPYAMDEKLMMKMPFIYAGDRRGTGGRTPYGVGGRMNHWGAVCTRFRPSTFLSRSLQGFGEDWPVTYEELVPYYLRAERELGVAGDHANYPFPREPFPLPAHSISYADQVLRKGFDAVGIKTFPQPRAIFSRIYSGRPACNYCGFCHWGCPMNAKASPVITHVPQAIAAGAEIRVRCYAREITVDQQGRASGVVYADPERREREQKVRVVLVACGSPMTGRLLLLSRSKQFPHGLANNNGQVGRNVWSSGERLDIGGLHEQRLDAFRGFGTLTSHDLYENNSGKGFAGGYTILTEGPAGVKLDELLRRAEAGWGRDLKAFMKDFYPHYVGLQAFAIGTVDSRNKVELDPDAMDEWGSPLAKVSIYRTANDGAIRRHAIQTLAEIHRAAGAVKVLGARSGDGPQAREESSLTVGGGECRMGNDPKTSVVNSFGQSHEVKNLFLLGWSVLLHGPPTPYTLTLVALTSRAGEYILKNRRNLITT